MIIEAIVNALGSIFSAIGNMFGEIPTPGFFYSISAGVTDLAGYAAGAAPWVPIGDAVTCLQFVMVIIGVALAIRVVRIVVSLFTAGGGSAG